MKFHWPTKVEVWLSLAIFYPCLGSAKADVVGASGSTDVPGYPVGTKIHYRVGAIKTADRGAHFWLQLSNPNNAEIKFVICPALRLNQAPVETEQFTLQKIGDQWQARPWSEAPQDTSQPPSFHFGCRTIALANHAKLNAYDAYALFSESACHPAGEFTWGTVSFDLLPYGELVDCDQIKGRNKNLTLVSPDKERTNLWTGRVEALALTPTGLSERDWSTGPWPKNDASRTGSFSARWAGVSAFIATVSEWGLFVIALLLLTSGAALLLRRPAMRSTGGMPLRHSDAKALPWFAQDIFRKALAVTLALVGAGFTAAVWQWEALSLAEAVGTLVAVGMGSYWVHLLIVSRSRR